MDSQLLIQLAVNGVIIGGIYALLAIGLSLIFGILGIVNFAHGEFYMLGATATYALVAVLGVGFWPAAAAVVALSALAGVVLYDLFLKRIDRRDFERSILLTVGIAMIVQNGALVLWGADPQFLRVASLAGSVAVQDVRVPITRLGALFASIGGIVALTCLLHFTRLGQAMRAVAANTAAAAVVGIPAHRIARVTVAVGLAMCGLAGATLAPVYSIHPLMGTLFVFKAFAIVIIGGMGNLMGAGIMAFSLGVLESVLGGYVSLATTEAIVFAAMIAMLLFRPLGLFGRGVRV